MKPVAVFAPLPGMMTCREFEDLMYAYLEHELPWYRRLFVWLHFVLCRECRAYVRRYNYSLEAGKAVFAAPEEPVPDDVPRELIAALRKARDRKATE